MLAAIHRAQRVSDSDHGFGPRASIGAGDFIPPDKGAPSSSGATDGFSPSGMIIPSAPIESSPSPFFRANLATGSSPSDWSMASRSPFASEPIQEPPPPPPSRSSDAASTESDAGASSGGATSSWGWFVALGVGVLGLIALKSTDVSSQGEWNERYGHGGHAYGTYGR